jgi:hypothetical protein
LVTILGRVILGFRGFYFAACDREVRAVHPAQIATTALFGMNNVRGMVTLGVESGGKREHVAGTELHTEAAGFTTLNDDRNASFCHEIST